jgi:hypothetical protein
MKERTLVSGVCPILMRLLMKNREPLTNFTALVQQWTQKRSHLYKKATYQRAYGVDSQLSAHCTHEFTLFFCLIQVVI